MGEWIQVLKRAKSGDVLTSSASPKLPTQNQATRPVSLLVPLPCRSDCSLRRCYAVDDVSFELRPGQVTGLIGPNGAGKTSLIDALSGFPPSSGQVLLGDLDLSRQSPTKRARSGLHDLFSRLSCSRIRRFQAISVAADPQDFGSYIRDLVWPVNPSSLQKSFAQSKRFGLDDDLHRDVRDLSYGKRRLLAIAQSVAMHPSVLMLDEPAAGLQLRESRELGRVVRRLADEWGMAFSLSSTIWNS